MYQLAFLAAKVIPKVVKGLKIDKGIEKVFDMTVDGVKKGNIMINEERKRRLVRNASGNDIEEIFKAAKYFEKEEGDISEALIYYRKAANLGCKKSQKEVIVLELQNEQYKNVNERSR